MDDVVTTSPTCNSHFALNTLQKCVWNSQGRNQQGAYTTLIDPVIVYPICHPRTHLVSKPVLYNVTDMALVHNDVGCGPAAQSISVCQEEENGFYALLQIGDFDGIDCKVRHQQTPLTHYLAFGAAG